MEHSDDIYDTDDLGNQFPHRSHTQSAHYPYRQRNQFHYYDAAQETSFFSGTLARLRDNLAGSNTNMGGSFGIAVAILVILVFQFRGLIFSWSRHYQEQLSGNWIMDFLIDIYDYARSYLQLGIDMLRNLRFLVTSSTGALLDNNVDVARTRSGKSGRSRRRRRFRESNSSAMPELEVVPVADGTTSLQAKEESSIKDDAIPDDSASVEKKEKSPPVARRIYRDEIEPAFLNEKDYPPGWLVYHPVLGVVPKTEADRYQKNEELHGSCSMATVVTSPAIKAS